MYGVQDECHFLLICLIYYYNQINSFRFDSIYNHKKKYKLRVQFWERWSTYLRVRRQTFIRAATMPTAMNAFKACGISNFNVHIFTDTGFIAAEATDIEVNAEKEPETVLTSDTIDSNNFTTDSNNYIVGF